MSEFGRELFSERQPLDENLLWDIHRGWLRSKAIPQCRRFRTHCFDANPSSVSQRRSKHVRLCILPQDQGALSGIYPVPQTDHDTRPWLAVRTTASTVNILECKDFAPPR
jgi:hypothetical protein